MKPILYIKGSYLGDVRLRKFVDFFVKRGENVCFWGWDRKRTGLKIAGVNVLYILKGGGSANKKLLLYYPLWMAILFFKALFARGLQKYNIIVINFDAALPIYLASRFKRINFIYEIYDEFSISYNFPLWLKRIFIFLDHKIIDNAEYVIHVDNNRINYRGKDNKKKVVVIENTPYDFFNGQERDYSLITHTFAVSGLMNSIRGLEQIISFAQKNPEVQILCIGGIDDVMLKKKAEKLDNVKCYDFMPQEDAFKLMQSCCAIFSLYNPALEINRFAASNKVYDAMMLGIPVITNKDVINSSFIIQHDIGYVVDYVYNSSWDILTSSDFVEKSHYKGVNGRKLYLKQYCFDKLVFSRLIPMLH